ncbi:hypothetical protein V5799_033849, partial [Amblyomma americanum]
LRVLIASVGVACALFNLLETGGTSCSFSNAGSLGMDHRSDSKWVLTSKDGTVHPLPAAMIFIGRQECDIIVDSASVDKRHAVIFFNPSDKCFHVKDLNSVTGTYLNGVRIPEQSYVKLNHLDSLRFGYDILYTFLLFVYVLVKLCICKHQGTCAFPPAD